jgi:hypothetical protein
MFGKGAAYALLTIQTTDRPVHFEAEIKGLTDQLASKNLSVGDVDSVMKVHAHLDLFYKGFSSN